MDEEILMIVEILEEVLQWLMVTRFKFISWWAIGDEFLIPGRIKRVSGVTARAEGRSRMTNGIAETEAE